MMEGTLVTTKMKIGLCCVILNLFIVGASRPSCFNGDLTGPQLRAIRLAESQIESLEAISEDTISMDTAELLYGPPIVRLNPRQTQQATDVYG